MKDAVRKQVRRVGRAVYWRLPPGWRDAVVDFSFRRAGRLFRGIEAYEVWRQRRAECPPHIAYGEGQLTDLAAVAPLEQPPGRIAVHAHMFYPDLAAEFAQQLRHIPFTFDLFVSVTDERGRQLCQRVFARLSRVGSLTVEIVPNRGRDIAPMLCAFGERLRDYDFLAHVHSKKSLYNRGATDGWRSYLLSALFGSEDRLRRLFRLLAEDTAMAYPQSYAKVPYIASTWLANRATGIAWGQRLGLRGLPTTGYFDFPVGSMFWARADALRPLFESGITLDDFPPESGQADGTLAHALERLLGLVASASGMPLAILRDGEQPSWSPWRLEQYFRRGRAAEGALLAADLRLLVFDIFDTLLIRPLIEPERIKEIVARRAGGELGELYLAWRAKAEGGARERAGRDVGLDAVYAELARCTGLDHESVERLRRLELQIESAAVSPRPGALALFERARASGKTMVLASDMYLPRATIEDMLQRHGFRGWDAFYLSSEVGLRKDSGALYRHLLEVYDVAPAEVLMVGDNERSDVQIPLDLGMRWLHLLRPVELARGMHRLRPLIERVEHAGSLEQHLGLGLVVRDCFGDPFPHPVEPGALLPRADADAIGYAIAGPLALAFAQWLIERATRDGVDRLYFLAREGQFLKAVYDRVAATRPNAPAADYLVVSRRTVNLPAIRSLDDVVRIAETVYGPAPLEDFLSERFGISPDPALLRDFDARGLWRLGRKVEIRDREIDHLRPLLEVLLPTIVAQGRREASGLQAYLGQLGLGPGRARGAVVDVGYSGTIQRRLNRLLGGGLDGYYMATYDDTASIETDCDARATGCYYHQSPGGVEAPLLFQMSFIVEKLFSSDDPQIVHYTVDAEGRPQPHFRALSEAERATVVPRAALRAGAMRLVDEALRIGDRLLPGFVFPTDVALALCETFLQGQSPAEQTLLSELVLDDHYCGRGVVA